MGTLHRFRRAALRLGLDVQRVGNSRVRHLIDLLNGRGVDLVLDVGANSGQYGEQLRDYGYGGEICSFEPIPAVYEALARRIAKDPSWSALNVALGASVGSVSLNITANEGGSSSVLPMLDRHRRASPDSGYVQAIDVPMQRLDAIWDQVAQPGSIPFLKLDVQGLESAVLDGLAGRSDDLTGLQLEVSLVPLYEGAMTLGETLDRMEALEMYLVNVEPVFWDMTTGELLQVDAVFLRHAGRD